MMSDSNPSLSGRVALITGANTGIGLVTARELCSRGMRVYIACRNLRAGQMALAEIRRAVPAATVELLDLDLGDLNSVRQCARDFLAFKLPLHVLINNAGVAGAKGLTQSGFEMAFGINHVGHFLLTQLLLDNLRATAQMAGTARVVTVASRAHQRVEAIDFEAVRQPTRTTTGLQEYSVSKLANILFSMELARRLKGSGVSTYALHPGVVATDVWRSLPWPIQPLIKRFMITAEEGAQTTIHCATAPSIATKTGLYWVNREIRNPRPIARDADLAKDLWQRSEAWVKD